METDSRNFDRIAKALALLTEHWREQPSLTWVAEEVGLSEFHLQRLFSRWVGVSPKRFVQYLTKESARSHLADAASLLEAAHACGLSGSARLHDLFVRYEGMTPGEFKAAVQGQPMTWGEVETPFGQAIAVFAPRGLHRLEFIDTAAAGAALLAELQHRYPDALWQPAQARQLDAVAKAFPGADVPTEKNVGEGSALSICVSGSAFQLKVWEALLAIPAGQSVSYGNLAQAIGHPGAARALGNAVGANAVAWLIPCHRVICESGVVGRFRWGSERKRAILGWERVRADTHGGALASA
jgi:AraC family transcriptional regulator of adaptative response/methylated-DNA-[protein]-cysteine methyltransferase